MIPRNIYWRLHVWWFHRCNARFRSWARNSPPSSEASAYQRSSVAALSLIPCQRWGWDSINYQQSIEDDGSTDDLMRHAKQTPRQRNLLSITYQWTDTSKMSCLAAIWAAISIHTSLFVPWRGRHGVEHGEAFTIATNAAFLTSLQAFLIAVPQSVVRSITHGRNISHACLSIPGIICR